MQALDTSITGTSGGVSPEEEALQKLVSALMKLPFDPVVLCGWRAYEMWLEIMCGTDFLASAFSSDGRGREEFKLVALASGRMTFTLSRETINTRSAMAWQVQEQRVMLCRNTGVSPDELLICDRRSLAQ